MFCIQDFNIRNVVSSNLLLFLFFPFVDSLPWFLHVFVFGKGGVETRGEMRSWLRLSFASEN